jgi:hypothetical protein
MIKFFRKIRQNLLSEGKTGKYLKYAIGEIVLVVIGILIALGINNGNEVRNNRKEETKSFKRILSDLETEKIMLENSKKQFSKSRKYLIDVVYNEKIDGLDSIIYHFTPFIHNKSNSEYISLKSSGKLNLITNDKLRYNLVNYYELYYNQYEVISELNKKILYGRTLDYFNNVFPTDTTNLLNPELVKQQLKDDKFKYIINDQIITLGDIIKSLNTSIIDSLTERINNETK